MNLNEERKKGKKERRKEKKRKVTLSPPLEVSRTIFGGSAFLACSRDDILAFNPSPPAPLTVARVDDEVRLPDE